MQSEPPVQSRGDRPARDPLRVTGERQRWPRARRLDRSSEPPPRGLGARAKRLRDAVKKSVRFDMDYYFDMVDKDPKTFVSP